MLDIDPILFSLTDAAFKQCGDADWTDIPWVTSADYEEADPLVREREGYCGRVKIVASKTSLGALARLTGTEIAHDELLASLPIQPRKRDGDKVQSYSLVLTCRTVNSENPRGIGRVVLYNAICSVPFKELIRFATGRLSAMTLHFDCYRSDRDENGELLNVPAVGRFEIREAKAERGTLALDDIRVAGVR